MNAKDELERTLQHPIANCNRTALRSATDARRAQRRPAFACAFSQTERVTVITDEVSLEIAAALAHELEEVGCAYSSWVLEDVATAPATDLPQPSLATISETSQVSIFAVHAQKQRTQIAHADDRHRQPAQNPPRAHGQHQQADHARRHARRFSRRWTA